VLKGNLDVEKIHRAGFDLYVVVRPETSVTTEILLFAVDWAKGHGFFYPAPGHERSLRVAWSAS
jgi:hypothetical protein